MLLKSNSIYNATVNGAPLFLQAAEAPYISREELFRIDVATRVETRSTSLATPTFDMRICKRFFLGDRITTVFRTEALNIFNHTQFTGFNNSSGCFGPNGSCDFNAGNSACLNGDDTQGIVASGFFHPNAVHDPRLVQFAFKRLF